MIDLGRFDSAISNPPFGAIKEDGFHGQYTGSKFEFKIMETASRLASHGAFIVQQNSAPFRYSGRSGLERMQDRELAKFLKQTGICMRTEPSIGVDTSQYQDEWRGVSPICEIVECDYVLPELKALEPMQHNLFMVAAE